MVDPSQINYRKTGIAYLTIVCLVVSAGIAWMARARLGGVRFENSFFIFLVVAPIAIAIIVIASWPIIGMPGRVDFSKNAFSFREPDGWTNLAVVIVLSLPSAFVAYLFSDYVNVAFDHAPATVHVVAVADQAVGKSRWFLRIADTIDGTPHIASYEVDQAIYRRMKISEQLMVNYHPGALGFPWVSDLREITAPSQLH